MMKLLRIREQPFEKLHVAYVRKSAKETGAWQDFSQIIPPKNLRLSLCCGIVFFNLKSWIRP
jgi:hypothetical protein